MIFYYIDESGTSLKDPESPYFVLAALAISEEMTQRLEREVILLKRRLISYAKSDDFEIKGRDLRQGKHLFRNMDWAARLQAMQEVAKLIASLPVEVIAVRVDTRDLPEYITSNADLFRIAFWRLLEEIDEELRQRETFGLLILDSQTTTNTSVQDRRLIDAYHDWASTRLMDPMFASQPFFGFSAFYGGLQMVDFVAYMISVVTDIETKMSGKSMAAIERINDLVDVFELFRPRVHLIDIP